MPKPKPATSPLSSADIDLELLKRHFLSNLHVGIVLGYKELVLYVKNKRLRIRKSVIRSLRRRWKFTAMFLKPKHKPAYMSASIMKFGIIMCDLGFFPDSYRKHNDNCIGFLVGKEMVSGAIATIPIKKKSIAELLRAVKLLVQKGPFKQCHTLVWDRESAVVSRTFQEEVSYLYGVRIFFLKARSKAYLAELAINYIKRHVNMSLASTQTKRWLEIIENVTSHYNEQKVPGTSFKRKSISRRNTEAFLVQKLRMKNPSLLFNSATVKPVHISGYWKKKIFKYDIGDSVLISKKAGVQGYATREANAEKAYKKKSKEDPSYKHRKTSVRASSTFHKASMSGNWSSASYTIASRKLKSNSKFYWAIVYTLVERSGFYYET